ncbi:hypothetical protein EW146_g258 [Bondarzewia mesenterica]|uniref:AB hydrolase-1 domain-containing protein n=1 Tax=Bondarzewia mesenterica TaxID=1095465 RepID=A0A4S4M7T9_9AGAM|nr:hypothetical protein EW146_g258 [Bondarzewia mesenterica]
MANTGFARLLVVFLLACVLSQIADARILNGTIAVGVNNTVLSYTDSGVPSGNLRSSYTTIFAVNGMGFNSGIFSKVQSLAGAAGFRIVAVNRRGYAGSTPYTAAELENNIPPLSADGKSGGAALVGWSLGNILSLAAIAHVDALPQDVQSRLASKVHTVIMQEPSSNALGLPAAPQNWVPQIDTSIPSDVRVPAFAQWVTAYFQHGNLSTRDPNVLSYVLPATFRTPSIFNMSQSQFQSIVDTGVNPVIDSQLIALAPQLLESYEGANYNTTIRSLLPKMKNWFVTGDVSAAFGPYALWLVQNDNDAAGGGLVNFKVIHGVNHFMHWDNPETALQVYHDYPYGISSTTWWRFPLMELLTSPLSALLFLSACCALAILFLRRNGRYARLPLPPSPSSLQRSHEFPWTLYAECSKTLGPLISLPAPPLSRPIIVINTTTAANDLLEKRRAFACRPRSPMAELLGRQDNIGFTYYGDRLKKMRKVLHASLNASAVPLYWSQLLDSQSLTLARDLLTSPETFYEAVEIHIQELIVRLTYGRKPDAEYIRIAKEVMRDTWEGLQPDRWMVNLIPALIWTPAWMPGAGFKRWARSARQLFLQTTRTPFYEVKASVDQGQAEASFVQQSLEELPAQHQQSDEDIIMCAAGSLFSAGTETVSGAILTFLLLMARHEEIQARAYEEIVTVAGKDRLPNLNDQQSLPFVDAVIQEVHRFHPAVPLATHSNYAADEYHGFRIPEKTWILANVWAMVHDENVYTEPNIFRPERFMPEDGADAPPDPRILTYGFGRRRCPGAHLANAVLYLNVSRILALYTICPEVKDGNPSPPPLDFMNAFVPYVRPMDYTWYTVSPVSQGTEIISMQIRASSKRRGITISDAGLSRLDAKT